MKKVRPFFVLLLNIFLVTAFSCSKNGDGEMTSREIGITPFTTLNIDGVFDIYIIPDTFCGISFLGEQRNVDRCNAEVINGELTITGSKKGEFLHPNEKTTEVYIHVDSLKRINVHEDCYIRTHERPLVGHEIGIVVDTRFMDADLEISTDVFYYWNNPNGTHLHLSGRTDELKIWNTGLGSVDASDVTSDYVLVENGAQNDCKVRAVQKLEYSLTSVGDIVYFGNPAEIVQIPAAGTGELIKGD